MMGNKTESAIVELSQDHAKEKRKLKEKVEQKDELLRECREKLVLWKTSLYECDSMKQAYEVEKLLDRINNQLEDDSDE